MSTGKVNLINKDQMIYIPAYVEQGIEKLEDAQSILEDIASKINRGIAIINSSGYNGGIPYIEKGDVVSFAIEQMQATISVITNELEKYNKGENILPDDAIIIADPKTARKYRLDKERINYTIDEYLSAYGVSPKWKSNFLTAAIGGIKYYGQDGRLTKETWCDLDPSNLATLMRKQGIDLDFWIREDGVYMYGDYVMVAADIPHMDGTQQAAEYRKGDLVETSLGTGMVVDLCGMAEMVRKGELRGTNDGDVEVWYDIYTAWHDDGKYEHVGYCNDPACISSHTVEKTMLSASETQGGQKTLSVPVNLSAQNDNNSSNDNKSLTDVIKDVFTNDSSSNIFSTLKSNISSAFSSNENMTPDTTQTQIVTNNSPVNSQNISIESSSSMPTDSSQNIVNNSQENSSNTLGEKIKDFITDNLNINQENTNNQNTNTSSNGSPKLASSFSNIANNLENGSNNNKEEYIIPMVNNKETEKKIETSSFLESLGLASVAGISTKIYMDSKKDDEDINQESTIKED